MLIWFIIIKIELCQIEEIVKYLLEVLFTWITKIKKLERATII